MILSNTDIDCPLCLGSDVVAKDCGMYLCTKCSFFFLGKKDREAQQATFHLRSKNEVDESDLEKVKLKYPKTSHPKRKLYDHYALRAKSWYGENIKVMDVGASGGFFLNAVERYCGAKKENLRTLEVEPNYVRLSLDYFGYDGDVGNIENYNPGQKFDLITMFDVLEHVDDFWRALDNISNILTADGRLLLKLPNGRFAYFKYKLAKFFGLKKRVPIYLHIRPGGHLNYWNFANINYLERDKFVLDSFEYVRPTVEQFGLSYPFRLTGFYLDRFFDLNLFPEMIVVFKKVSSTER